MLRNEPTTRSLFRRLVLLVLGLLILEGCQAPVVIESLGTKGFEPTRVKTFAIRSENPALFMGILAGADYPKLQKRLIGETIRILEEKGLEKVDDTLAADILVSFRIGLSLELVDSIQVNSPDQLNYDPSSFYTQTTDIFFGDLVVVFWDPKTMRALWEGKAITRSARPSTGENDARSTARRLQQILDRFRLP